MSISYNPYSLEGKTILVTGASSGIGRATAIECSKMGATLVLTGRNEERLKATLDALEGTGHRMIPADLGNQESLEALVASVPTLDGAVLSAGISRVVPVDFANPQKMQTVFNTNFFSTVELNRLLSKKKKYAKNASVVVISSIAAIHYNFGNGIYGASKAALSTWCKYVAREWKEKGRRINCILPGMTETPLIRGGNFTDEQLAEDAKAYIHGRYGRPEEIAWGAVYLLSDAAQWISGTDLKIAGGTAL